MNKIQERCDNCYFFELFGDDEGLCRRYPPQNISKDSDADGLEAGHWLLPIVDDCGWCGEFKFDPSRIIEREGE